MHPTETNERLVSDAPRITAEAMLHYLPGERQTLPPLPQMQDVVVQFFSHHTMFEPILIPAVVEPLLVLVLAGAATIEERSLDGEWEAHDIKAGNFFLTNTSAPYEMRWHTHNGDTFQVMHLYLGLPLIDQAANDVLGVNGEAVTFLEISGGQDERIKFMMDQLRIELINEYPPSLLFLRSLAQALAVHLVRNYLDSHNAARRINALQMYKLKRVIQAMHESLAKEFSLGQLATVAELSDYHFSRMFKQATGLSPSQYFIRMRISRARHLLLETERSIIDIGMEVGYSSPSHFSQVFRREVGVTPSAYRHG
ncbi:helix-turn-helix domain-containing protein [Vreelandella titanicae]|uniref:helix-turn-helix domain-containing protein n=1 Tax=Halomonadaceae TaxID=28256 RepID=UPI0004ACF08B|nr:MULTISPECIES: helix-turn-helix domain-containing protein [Halomonas]NAO96051.1 helix-turn-helix domain-containing protein [Halomonas sp. MG34]PKH60245.1 AraC family transcriptional regulator [Halomonas sp. Choline-3u-9]QGQ69411.1 helix-turn-helix domain-containing protein [Halomonas sp. PA16-9]